MNFTLLIANMGTAIAAQLAAGRLLYGMGKGNALPRSFFGVIEPRHRVPRNGIILVGVLALVGAATLEFFSGSLGGSAYAVGAQALNFGAFIAFMGVNAAAFVHYWWRGEGRTWSHLPGTGAGVCNLRLHLDSFESRRNDIGCGLDDGRNCLWRDPHPGLPLGPDQFRLAAGRRLKRQARHAAA